MGSIRLLQLGLVGQRDGCDGGPEPVLLDVLVAAHVDSSIAMLPAEILGGKEKWDPEVTCAGQGPESLDIENFQPQRPASDMVSRLGHPSPLQKSPRNFGQVDLRSRLQWPVGGLAGRCGVCPGNGRADLPLHDQREKWRG